MIEALKETALTEIELRMYRCLMNEHCPKGLDIYTLKYNYSLSEFLALEEVLEIRSALDQARHEDMPKP